MKVIPVIDLKGGIVVRGVAGRREDYRPIVSQLVSKPTPRAVAEAFVERFGFREVYIADLDAIAGREPNYVAYREILGCGLTLWIDAGVGALDQAHALLHLPGYLIVGLESLESPDELARIIAACGSDRIVFSLDLKAGRPLTRVGAWQHAEPLAIVAAAVKSGMRRMIVLDLADVGVGGGTGTLELVRQLLSRYPQLEITAGGGVRGVDDLRRLAAAGCSSALVASALHDGRLTPEETQEFR
jgi:phosphoribosylformimino-5-aminoimidazole carboxamide ribotide isomerase